MEQTIEELCVQLSVPTVWDATGNPDLSSVVRRGGHPVTRFPEQLHLHSALEDVGWNDVISEFNAAIQFSDLSVPEPILITSDGTILAGFARWRLAALEGRRELHCIEYVLSPDEALRFLLAYHQPRTGWNAFVRIRLALTLEPYFQQKALANMREGGKCKGLANLPEAHRIDVRQEIAKVARVGARGRNVSNVKNILQTAHPRLICALQDGTLTIHRALQFCKVSQPQQLADFIRYSEDRATMKLVRQSLRGFKKRKNLPNAASALEALRTIEEIQPGSVVIQAARLQRTVILIGQDLLSEPHSQRQLELK